MPGHRDWYVAQLAQRLNFGTLAHHQRASAHSRVETDDLAAAERLYPLDRRPFADRVNLERALLRLRLLPALPEILDPAVFPLLVLFMIIDLNTSVRELTHPESHAPERIR